MSFACYLFVERRNAVGARFTASTRHTVTIKAVASLNPRRPGLAERRSSERVGMDTSATEITKIAIPSAVTDEWLCL